MSASEMYAKGHDDGWNAAMAKMKEGLSTDGYVDRVRRYIEEAKVMK